MDPALVEAWVHLGKALFALRRLTDAVTSYRRALTLQPRHAAAHLALGVALRAQHRHTDRVVITASKWQVRQKMHRGSTGRWRHYEAHLGPLRELAGGWGGGASGWAAGRELSILAGH